MNTTTAALISDAARQEIADAQHRVRAAYAATRFLGTEANRAEYEAAKLARAEAIGAAYRAIGRKGYDPIYGWVS